MLVGILACSEDFTESTAFGALSDAALQNAQGVELKLIGAYSLLDGHSDTGSADWEKTADGWWYDVIADDAHKGSTDGDQADLFLLETFNWNTTNPYIGGRWRSLFASVNRCNAVLDLISQVEEGDFTQQAAEARFLRGHYNFELQKMWVKVPFISVENYQNVEFNQPNPGDIYEQIAEDFTFAMNNLPDDNDVGRPNKYTAMAFLGKTHLYRATLDSDANRDAELSAALGYFETVIASGKYHLLDEFADNFRLAGENGAESIFAIQFTADQGQSFNGNRGGTLSFPNPGPLANCCGFYQPTQDLVNAYKTEAGLPLLDTYNNSDVANDYGIESSQPFVMHTGPLDPRLDYTVGRRGIDMNGWEVNPGKDWIRANFADISGPYLTKKNFYWAGDDANRGTGGWGEQRSGINYHIMRYADVLLMSAECKAALGADDLGLAYVNEVRARAKDMTYVKNAGGADAANYSIEEYGSFSGADHAMKAIRFERRLEFGCEGQRLFDLRRWGVAKEVITEYIANEARTITPFGVAANPYQDKHDLAPIPLGAIDLSGGALSQNPGY